MTIFGNWQAVRKLGSGSYGNVYLIKREELGHTYYSALKHITLDAEQDYDMDDASISSFNYDMAKSIANEMKLMNKLRGNSHIVSYEDHQIIEQERGYDVLIRMELLVSLPEYTRTHTLDEAQVVKIGIDLCKALELCESLKIMHRDIKPANIFISPAGDAKLGDFGIARQLEHSRTSLSRKGTNNYMAPEVYKSDPYNQTADIYSLGLVLYRLLNGNRMPFMPPAPQPYLPSDLDESLHKRISGVKIPPPQNATSDIGQTILKALQFNPEDRYQSAVEFGQALLAHGGRSLEPAHADTSEDATPTKVLNYSTGDSQGGNEMLFPTSPREEQAPEDGTAVLYPEPPSSGTWQSPSGNGKSNITENHEQEVITDTSRQEAGQSEEATSQTTDKSRRLKPPHIAAIAIVAIVLVAAIWIGSTAKSDKEALPKQGYTQPPVSTSPIVESEPAIASDNASPTPSAEGNDEEEPSQTEQTYAADQASQIALAYDQYIADVLIPQFGVADPADIRDYYHFMNEDDAQLGLISALQQDMDDDGIDELICFNFEEGEDGYNSLYLYAYGYNDGQVTQLPCDDNFGSYLGDMHSSTSVYLHTYGGTKYIALFTYGGVDLWRVLGGEFVKELCLHGNTDIDTYEVYVSSGKLPPQYDGMFLEFGGDGWRDLYSKSFVGNAAEWDESIGEPVGEIDYANSYLEAYNSMHQAMNDILPPYGIEYTGYNTSITEEDIPGVGFGTICYEDADDQAILLHLWEDFTGFNEGE